MSSTKKKHIGVVNLELTALSIAANKAGLSYGKFVAHITIEERRAIIQEYKRSLNLEGPCVDLQTDKQ